MSNYRELATTKEIIIFRDNEFSNQWDTLPPGVYEIHKSGTLFDNYLAFDRASKIDDLVRFKTGLVNDIIHATQEFFSDRVVAGYKSLKLCHKMGIILHGPHGTGKSCTARLVMEEIVEKYKAICLIASYKAIPFILDTIDQIRGIQKNPIVIFMDEIDYTISIEENNILSFLDGGDSKDGVMFMGCTNYLHKIPDRIKHRKSRIKHLYEVKSLPEEVYNEYLKDKLPSMEGKVLAEFSYKAVEAGLTIDQLKNALIDHHVDGVTIDAAIKGVKT